MKKKKYIVPDTVVIDVASDCALLSGSGENKYNTTGGGPQDDIPIDEGGLDTGNGEEVAAKPHSLWDSGAGDSSGSSWGNPWN